MSRTSTLFAVAAAVLLSVGCASPDGDPPQGDAEDELVASKAAGAFQHWGTQHAEGELFQLLLRPDKTFAMSLKGEFGCDVYAGYSCPSSWSDGRTGDTDVEGTWKATPKGLELQPKGEGRPSAVIPMTLTVSGTKAKIEGTIVPHRRIYGDLDVVALFGKAHGAKESDLFGTWKVVGPNDADGDQPTLEGTNVYVGTKYTHTIVFRSDSKTYRDDRSDSRRRKDDGRFLIGGAPDGQGLGVLVLDRPGLFDAVPIVSLADGKATFDVNPEAGHRKLHAEKQ